MSQDTWDLSNIPSNYRLSRLSQDPWDQAPREPGHLELGSVECEAINVFPNLGGTLSTRPLQIKQLTHKLLMKREVFY